MYQLFYLYLQNNIKQKKFSMKSIMNIAVGIKTDRGVDALSGVEWYG